jgi:hypothetical protein
MSVSFVEMPLTYEIYRLSGFSGAGSPTTGALMLLFKRFENGGGVPRNFDALPGLDLDNGYPMMQRITV